MLIFLHKSVTGNSPDNSSIIWYSSYRAEYSMNEKFQITEMEKSTYTLIRDCVISAQNKVAQAVNSAMVTAYWEIGKQIYEACGENERAEYGRGLLRFLSESLTLEFGKGFDESNLRKCVNFIVFFQIETQFVPN